MLTIENYALILIFYSLVGTLQGMGNAYFNGRASTSVRYNFGYIVCAGIGLVYAFLGLLWFGLAPALYVYLPVLLLWWGGLRFGRLLFPIPDRGIALFVIICVTAVISIYYHLP